MTNSDWIALGVGSYAAIVASIALVWNIIKERRRLVIRIGSLEFLSELGEDKEMFSVRIINKTHREVNISTVGFIFRDGARYNLDMEFLKIPKQITRENSCYFYVNIFNARKVAQALDKTFRFFCVEDGTGRIYRSTMPKQTMKALNR